MSTCLWQQTFRVQTLFAGFLISITASGQTSSDRQAMQSEYDEILKEERRQIGSEYTREYIASGAAAVVIGLYGYYNTSPNPLVKLLYVATQTAGVLTIGQAMRGQSSSSLTLDIDRELENAVDGKVSAASIRERIVLGRRSTRQANSKTIAYTSAVLSTLYFYNGYRESSSDSSLRNAYYFLAFNFAIASGVGFYQNQKLESEDGGVALNFTPLPSLAYVF